MPCRARTGSREAAIAVCVREETDWRNQEGDEECKTNRRRETWSLVFYA